MKKKKIITYNKMLRKNIVNNDIQKMKEDIIETYQDFGVSQYLSHYEIMANLPSVSCCSIKYAYRSTYDQYWTNFYCQKTMNTNTDLLSLKFT